MDPLTFMIAAAQVKLRLDTLARHPDWVRNLGPPAMTPKLQGLTTAMGLLKSRIETESDKLIARVEAANAKTGSAFAKANATLDEAASGLSEIESFIASLEGSNGGPPLSDSSAPSAPAPSATPSAQNPVTPPPAPGSSPATPEPLSVNGVAQS